jgi:hypothetical protein
MNCPFERFGKNAVAFITFNYDRLLEYYLFTCLKNSYGRSIEACAEQLNQIPIVHLHGDLGALPWQKVEASREYGAIVSVEEIKVAASRIKIIHEDTADRDKEFGRAKEELGKATRIYFLGFGYNPTNMARLGVVDIREGIAEGTAHHLTPHEQAQIRTASFGKLTLHGMDCIQLLQNVVQW